MNALLAILNSPSGKPSSTRAMTMLVTTCIIGTWTFVSVAKRELQPLSEWHVGAVAVAMGAKVWQRGKETRGDNDHDRKPPQL